MKDNGKEIPRGLVAHKREGNHSQLTNVPPEKWGAPSFHPLNDGSGKDRFGNRIHYSPDFAYLDRSDKVVRAGLLLSQHGQTLIRNMPGCLTQLDYAIKQISETSQPKVEFKHGFLSDSSNSGDQSKIYIWKTPNGEKYIIKVPTSSRRIVLDSDRTDQPYINEMLQTQEIEENLQWLSKEKRVHLSTFLFASSNVSCTKFEEGQHPENWTEDQYERVTAFAKGVRAHISGRRHSGDGLFLTVTADLEDPDGTVPPYENVIVGIDGSMTWIDPFLTERFFS